MKVFEKFREIEIISKNYCGFYKDFFLFPFLEMEKNRQTVHVHYNS